MKISPLMIEGVGATALAALFGVGMAHWSVSAPLLASAGSAIAENVLGNYTDRMMVHGSGWLLDRLAGVAQQGQLPLNHDLICAVRKAQILAVEAIAQRLAETLKADELATDHTAQEEARRLAKFVRAIAYWANTAKKQLDEHDFEDDDTVSVKLAAAEISWRHFGRCPATNVADSFALLWREAGSLMLQELDAAEIQDIPSGFSDLMEGSSNLDGVTWANATATFFMEEIKNNPVVYHVVSLEMLHHLSEDIGRGRDMVLDRQIETQAALGAIAGNLTREVSGLKESLIEVKLALAKLEKSHTLLRSRSRKTQAAKKRRKTA